ncbi:GUK1.2 family protein [Megaselia abdita]
MSLPRPIVIGGPSGSGKSTFLQKIFQEYPETFAFCVSHTTRKPRHGERNGVDYYFISPEKMKRKLDNGEFLESVEFGGNFYGTSKTSIEEIQRKGKVCVLDIDVRGIDKLRSTKFNPIYIFIKPPSLEVLRSRLQGRNSETEESLQLRMNRVEKELEYAEVPGNFHKIITNENLHCSYKEFKSFILEQLNEQNENGANISF